VTGIITPAKEVTFFIFVHSRGQILMNIFNKRLDFVGDPDWDAGPETFTTAGYIGPM